MRCWGGNHRRVAHPRGLLHAARGGNHALALDAGDHFNLTAHIQDATIRLWFKNAREIIAGRTKAWKVPPLWDGATAPRVVDDLMKRFGGRR